MNTYWFIWEGKNSLADYGLWVRKLPKRTRPKERHEEVVIPGRAGSLILTEGEEVYESYSDEMTVSCKNTVNTDRILEWLRGSGELILSDDLGKARTARIVGEVSFDRDDKNKLLIGTVPLLFQPFKKAADESIYRTTITATSTIYNPGDVKGKPKLTLTGTGALTIACGGTQMAFAHRPDGLVVDCDAQIMVATAQAYGPTAYYYRGDYMKIVESGVSVLYRITVEGVGSAAEWERVGVAPAVFEYLWPGEWSGEYLRIPTGSQTITVTGTAGITIDPQWRWL